MLTKRFTSVSLSALLLFALVALAAVPAAQAQQAGYVQQQVILGQMPEMQQAQQQLEQRIQSERKAIQTEQQELQQQFQRLREQSQMLSEESRQDRLQELQQQRQALQQSLQERDQEIAELESELLSPVFEKFQNAVDAVAAERGLRFVLRREVLLYSNDDYMVDITEEVASRLGVELQASAAARSGR